MVTSHAAMWRGNDPPGSSWRILLAVVFAALLIFCGLGGVFYLSMAAPNRPKQAFDALLRQDPNTAAAARHAGGDRRYLVLPGYKHSVEDDDRWVAPGLADEDAAALPAEQRNNQTWMSGMTYSALADQHYWTAYHFAKAYNKRMAGLNGP